MIKIPCSDIVEKFSGTCGVWVPDAEDGELARVAEFVIAKDIKCISCAATSVVRMWPWLEGRGVKIYARFYVDSAPRAFSAAVSDLCSRVRAAFKDGADGVQIFIKASNLGRFVNEISAVRDDLFFGKRLSIGLDISEIEPDMWATVRRALDAVRTDAALFALAKYDEAKSDYVGRLFAGLNAWDGARYPICFALPSVVLPMAQSLRLVEKLRPDMMAGSVFWVRW